MIKQFTCEKCSTKFEKEWYLSRKIPRFCSKECRKRSEIVECEVCKKSFRKYFSRKNHKFCSQKCRGVSQRRQEKTCLYCKKEFNNTNDKYCSYKCFNKHRIDLILKKPCAYCGKIFSSKKSFQDRPYCSVECSRAAIKSSGKLAKENNPAWRGGSISYRGPNWEKQRLKARNRDNNTCQLCGKTSNKISLPVHHIVPFREFGIENYKKANELSNLITLCPKCHSRVDRGIISIPGTKPIKKTKRDNNGKWVF